MRLTVRVVLVACLAVTSFASVANATDHEVLMNGDYFGAMFFDPPFITVNPGDRVRWRNAMIVIHTATSGTDCTPNGQWTTGSLDPNAVSPYVTFNNLGTFEYFCRFHCEMGMVGSIEVQQVVKVQQTTWGSIKALYKGTTTRR
jgi:plastocyanin